MDRDNYDLLTAFSTTLPLEGPATTPHGSPRVDEEGPPSGEGPAPAADSDEDEAITGAGGAYL